MTILNEDKCLFLVIDIQEKLLRATFNNDILEKNASIIATAASKLKIPVVVTEQYPKGLGATVETIKTNLKDAYYYEKTSFSALDEPDIMDIINKFNKKQIVLFGIETHICVNQTAYSLVQQGYDVTLIKDASGSRKEYEHNAGIERIRDHGAHIITTEIALFELLKSSKHEKFKEIQALIK